MSKMLKITKPDGTINFVHPVNHARLKHHNTLLPDNTKWLIEEGEYEEGKTGTADEGKIFWTPNGGERKEVTSWRDEDLGKVGLETTKELVEKNQQQATELENLRAQIAQLTDAQQSKKPDDNGSSTKAADLIEAIKIAPTVEKVNEILGTDTRKTVQDAATTRIAQLTDAQS